MIWIVNFDPVPHLQNFGIAAVAAYIYGGRACTTYVTDGNNIPSRLIMRQVEYIKIKLRLKPAP